MAKIMIVDDEEDIRASLRIILEAKGYEISEASSADQCLKTVNNVNPDLILMDIMMPGSHVQDILPQLSKFKIIMASVVTPGEKKVAESGKEVPTSKNFSNIVDYVQKPFDNDELFAKIEKALK